MAVVKGSPAFQNDVLANDIIRQINGIDILDAQHAVEVINNNRGKVVALTVLRNGEKIYKEFRLNE